MHTLHERSLAVTIWLLAMLLLTGCLPNRIAFDLDPGDGRIRSSEVYRDPDEGWFSPQRIAIIDINGLISHTPQPGLIAPRSNAVDMTVARLREAERDHSVRAVILRVNSPGGTVAATDTLYHEIRRFRERTGKAVVVSMAEVAASGGYYISLAADHIVAQPSTVTGSIGVIFQTFNVSEGMSMIGIKGRAVTSDRNKAIASPFESAREEHYEILQSVVDDFYGAFRGLVVEHRRDLAETDLSRATDGRIFTGAQALELGLVDQLGTLYDAFEVAKQLSGVTSARLIKYHAEGVRVNSPYASTTDIRPIAFDQRVDISLLKIEHDQFATGFYYLWRP